MGNKLITQTILIITAITIVITYIRPSFDEIAEVQDDLARYQSTVNKASELNAALQAVIATERSISASDQARLQTYLPRTINNVTIMRDIQSVFNLIGVPVTSLTSASDNMTAAPVLEEGDVPQMVESTLVFRDFNVTFLGTYEQLKTVLGAIEANAYPLEVVSLAFDAGANVSQAESSSGLEPGTMQYSLTLRAYALPTS